MLLLSARAEAQIGATVANWSVPRASSSHAGAKGTMGDATQALPFIGVTPCRIVDTRGPAGPFGGPSLPAGAPRNFALKTGPCTGLPSSVDAYSLNITVTNTQGPGFILAYPQGGSQPVVSTLNYLAGQTVANAAIVPSGTSDGITLVAGVSGTDVIVDINGYFSGVLNNNRALTLIGNNGITVLDVVNSATNFGSAIFAQTAATFQFNATIEAEANGQTGKIWGVAGFTASADPGTAGLYGSDASFDLGLGGSALPSGVWGTSKGGYGVIGVSRVDGVKGVFIDSSNNALSAGHLGHDATNGVFASGNFAATGTKAFVEPHPLSAGKAIVYVALEGPEAGTYFRGRGSLHGGTGVISVPESFRMVSDDDGLTVQITPIGQAASVAVVSADLNSVVVSSAAADLDFYYVVNGVRKSFKNWDPMGQPDYFIPEGPDSRIPLWLSAEQRARLVANGTYNSDGSVNMATADRAGWTKIWADQKAARAAQDPSMPSTLPNRR